MVNAKQNRRNNLALANSARAQRPSSAPPPADRAADAGAVDEANLSQAATTRAVEPAAAASGAAGAADAMAAAESSSGGLDSSCALERSSSTPSPAPLPTGGAEPMAPGSDELDGCEADGESDAPPQARMISALEEAELFVEVTELNKRRSMHFHACIMGGANPTLLAHVAGHRFVPAG